MGFVTGDHHDSNNKHTRTQSQQNRDLAGLVIDAFKGHRRQQQQQQQQQQQPSQHEEQPHISSRAFALAIPQEVHFPLRQSRERTPHQHSQRQKQQQRQQSSQQDAAMIMHASDRQRASPAPSCSVGSTNSDELVEDVSCVEHDHHHNQKPLSISEGRHDGQEEEEWRRRSRRSLSFADALVLSADHTSDPSQSCQQPHNEHTALLGPPPVGSADESDDRSYVNHQPANQYWTRLVENVRSGEILLQSSITNVHGADHIEDHNAQRKRKRALDRIRSYVDFSLQHCLLAIVCYLIIAVVAFSYVFEHWSIIDSMYFAVVTFTTIGYGDLVPESSAGRIFTCIFALSGVAFLGIAIGVMGNSILEAEEQAAKQAGKASQFNVMSLFGGSSTADPRDDSTVVAEDMDTYHDRSTEENKSQHSACFRMMLLGGLVFVLLVVFLVILTISDYGIPDTIGSALYYAVVTASTVGYGDITPKTQLGRLFATMFIPLAVGAMGQWLSIVANIIVESRQAKFRLMQMSHELTQEDLDVMDGDGDGNVTRAEFLEFMLVAMGKINRDLIDELRQQFAQLDVDGTGVLSRHDLITQARCKLHCPKRKLELANYKWKLLEQARQGQNHDKQQEQEQQFGNPLTLLVGSNPLARMASALKIFAGDSQDPHSGHTDGTIDRDGEECDHETLTESIHDF